MAMAYELWIPFLTFVSTTALGGALLRFRQARREPLRARLRGGGQGAYVPHAGIKELLGRDIERLATMASVGRPSQRLKQQLLRAGYFGRNAATVYLGIKVLLGLVGATGTLLLLLPTGAPLYLTVTGVAGVAALLSSIPNLIVGLRRAKRSEEIRSHLPDALDLLEICVSSGMGVDMAWNAVAEEVRGVSTTLADELALTNLELHLGAPRAQAMRRMAERTGAQEIASLVAVLIQSERFGTSISDALRTYAAGMRERRSLRAAEAAEKTAVKLLFPMVLFIFPVILVVAVGPACIVLADLMGWR